MTRKTRKPPSEYLTPAEVAIQLRVTAQTVRSMCDRGELNPHITIGVPGGRTTYRIHRQAIDRLVHDSPLDIQLDPAPLPLASADDDQEYIRNWGKSNTVT
ncbi:MAG: helix-turn-helix domain-containing protein [Pirellulaceae bacterium]|nr:helix-turn-helix domain-containing protein [Pirellulaceae bacterium]